MPTTLTLTRIPNEFHQRLEAWRSVSAEAIACLESVLLSVDVPPSERLARVRTLRRSLPAASFRATDIDAFK